LRGRGTLAVGSFADVVVFDPKAEWTYRATEGKSKAKNTPFDGWPMLGNGALDGERRKDRLRWRVAFSFQPSAFSYQLSVFRSKFADFGSKRSLLRGPYDL